MLKKFQKNSQKKGGIMGISHVECFFVLFYAFMVSLAVTRVIIWYDFFVFIVIS
jgi:hypothetical protein